MTIDLFTPFKSDRPQKLYEAIKPYIRDGLSILDIGCGHAPLFGFIHRDFPNAELHGFDSSFSTITDAASIHPYATFWLSAFKINVAHIIKQRYDIIIHTGVDAEYYSKISAIHGKLLTIQSIRPSYVLLETGDKKERSRHMRAYGKAQNAYFVHHYKMMDSGCFGFDVEKHHLNIRRWCILGRGQ